MDFKIDTQSIFGILRRQFSLILSTVILVLITSVLILYSITPKYTANSLILVDTSYKDILDTDVRIQNSNTDNARVESEVGILKSDRILLDVIQENNLIGDAEFGVRLSMSDRVLSWLRLPLSAPLTSEEALGNVLNALKPALSVKRNGLTYLINIGVESLDPVKSARLANAVADSYIKQQIDAKVSSTLKARDTIQDRVIAANAAIVENEKNFDNYITQNIDRLEKETHSADLTALRAQLDKLNQMRIQQNMRATALGKSIVDQDFKTIAATLGSDALRQLEKQRQGLADRILAAQDNQTVLNLRSELEKINTNIEFQATEYLDSMRRTVTDFQSQANEVQTQIRSAFLKSNMPPEILTDIYGLQQSAEIARSQYQNLLSKLQELNSKSHLQIPDSRVISPALPSSLPSYPNKILILSIAFVAAIGLGVALSVCREYYIGGFLNEDQVEAVLKLPLAAVSPYQLASDKSADGLSKGNIADHIVSSPLSQFSESIRRLRLTLDQAERKKIKSGIKTNGCKIIMVTSSLSGEGKSIVALALARAYAVTGKRTLLIDCDLRKPSIGKYLNLDVKYDLIDYLQQENDIHTLSSIVIKDPVSPVIALPTNRRSHVATDELLMSDKMAHILTISRKHFDYIVLDTPPIEPIVDALYLSRLADMIVFVVQWASTAQTSAKQSVLALKEFKNPEAGIVAMLNQKKRPQISGYFEKKSNYYYE